MAPRVPGHRETPDGSSSLRTLVWPTCSCPNLLLLVACPEHRGIIGAGDGESRLVCGENSAISGAFEHAEICRFLLISAQRCQRPQRLWKVLHRDDAEPIGIAPRLPRVVAGRHEEDVH